jgi:hypothetical protein
LYFSSVFGCVLRSNATQLNCILTATPFADFDRVVDYMSQCSSAPTWGGCTVSYWNPLAGMSESAPGGDGCSSAHLQAVAAYGGAFGETLRGTGLGSTLEGGGVFVTSCVTHCGFMKRDWADVTIGGVSMADATAAWWQAAADSPADAHAHWPCAIAPGGAGAGPGGGAHGYQCNPSCPLPGEAYNGTGAGAGASEAVAGSAAPPEQLGGMRARLMAMQIEVEEETVGTGLLLVLGGSLGVWCRGKDARSRR